MKKTALYLLGILLLGPMTASRALAISIENFGDQLYRPENLPVGPATSASVETKVSTIVLYGVNLILFASGSVAVLMLVIGGIRYIVSFGNEEMRTGAKNTIKNALLGLAIVIFAYAIVTNVVSLIYRATV